jgi:hypothetical protein
MCRFSTRRAWTVPMISALSMPLQGDRGDAEIGVSEPAWDDDQRDTLARHLDGVGVAELVRRESSPDAGERCRVAQLFARGGRACRGGRGPSRGGRRGQPR